MHYLLRDDRVSDQWTDATMLPNPARRQLRVSQPHPIADRWPRSQMRVDTAEPLQDWFVSGLFRMASERLAKVVAEEVGPDQLELLEVELCRSGGAPLQGAGRYFYLHTLNSVDALDRERSELVLEDDGWVDEIDRLVLDPGKAAPHALFELAGNSLGLLLVREDLKKLIEAGGFTGITFEDPGTWSSR